MPYDDRKKLMTPDFYPQQQQGWIDMGQDQPINIQPAVGAFQQRFMQKPNMGTGNPPMPMSTPEMDTVNMNADIGGAPMKKGGGMKSL